MKSRLRVLCLLVTAFVPAAGNASPSAGEFRRCHEIAAASLGQCLDAGPGQGNDICWRNARQMNDACYRHVHEQYRVRDHSVEKARRSAQTQAKDAEASTR